MFVFSNFKVVALELKRLLVGIW